MTERIISWSLAVVWALSVLGLTLPKFQDSTIERVSTITVVALPLLAVAAAFVAALREEYAAQLAAAENAATAERSRTLKVVLDRRTVARERDKARAQVARLQARPATAEDRLNAMHGQLDRLLAYSARFEHDQSLTMEAVDAFADTVRTLLAILSAEFKSSETYSFDETLSRGVSFGWDQDGNVVLFPRARGARAHEWLRSFRRRLTPSMLRQDLPPFHVGADTDQAGS